MTARGGGAPFAIQKLYVRLMMWLVARLLTEASVVDPLVRHEVLALPEGDRLSASSNVLVLAACIECPESVDDNP